MKKKKFLKVIAVYMALSLLFEIFFPTVALALTGGPAQPESSSFEPVGTSEMVDLFSGDYNYNIPLIDVGGYPVNISYHSGVSMDQEASWVGLGWNINPGAINRSMRGLPDDFKGDKVIKEFNVKPNQTYGANFGFGAAVAGYEGLSLSFSIGAKYNNYTGVGFEQSANIAFTAGESGKTSGTASLGLKSSAEGLDISPSVSASAVNDKKDGADTKMGASLGTSFNSRSGLKALTLNVSIEQGTTNKYNKKSEKISSDGPFQGLSNSIGTGCSYSFTNPTYIPSISMPMKNLSVTTSFKMGATLFTIDGSMNVSGYYSEQRLAEKKQEIPAYGYMYSEEAGTLDRALLDFNREKDGAFTKTTPCLPLTNYSYDLFSVSGQGVGGMFRPFRSDLGYVFDSRNTTTSEGYSLGLEIGSGNMAQGGGDITINDVNSTSGKWTENNKAIENLKFRKTVANKPLYEPYYFKEAGEKNVDSYSQLYDAIGKEKPARVGLLNDGAFEVRAKNTFVVGENPATVTEPNIPTVSYREVRQRRNQLFSFINRGEYATSAIDNTLDASIYTAPSVTPNKNHIAEITTSKTDGSRYVYGIPAYNTKQREVTFNKGLESNGAGRLLADINAGLVAYTGTDNSKDNLQGVDNYFSSTQLPAYAHSYLLTAVLSPDYVDITGNGLTTDDYGNYTKFSYSKAATAGDGIYKWRVPYGLNKANFNEGLKTGDLDEQGNYVYGEKEIWMLDKIETKNYIAIFTKKGRADGFDVNDENGRIGNSTTPLLKKISLFSRPDYLPNGIVNVNAIPIKEVHFEYDYSLCPNTLNNVAHLDNSSYSSGLWTQDECETANQGGKLTLQKIYFTYGKSNKAKLNPYKFYYTKSNRPYGMKDYDKWGNYKKNDIAGGLTNAEFPYVEQERAVIPSNHLEYDIDNPNGTFADLNSASWTLEKIDLPSGGTIKVQYESDDYAFVQDRRAMQMFKITGAATGVGASPSSSPTTGSILGGSDYLFFKLQNPIIQTTPDSWIAENYLQGINNLYFRFLIKVNGAFPVGKEYVSGYAEKIWVSGFAKDPSTIINGEYTYGFIQLKDIDIGDKPISENVNPISKAAIQFARINTPKQAYGTQGIVEPTDPNPSAVTITSVIKAMADASFVKNIISTFQGANEYLYNPTPLGKGYGRDIELNKCWVRLLNPNQKKLGGGTRVKKITITDEWAGMLAGTPDPTKTFSYGQVYDYTKIENEKVISSGVAAYEPLVGGDENPFRVPVPFGQKIMWAADLDYFQEEPFGECFFPSASVGYSKVTVKNLQYAAVKHHATGAVVSEFYTARDYPVIARRTPMDARPKKTGALLQLLKLKVRDYMTASQGFAIELNDMHGRPKATRVYAEDQGASISGVDYKYKSIGNKLNNEASVINKDGSIQTAQIGIDYDFVADMREQKTDVLNAGIQVNLYAFLAGPIPILIPPILPTFSSESTRLRTASVTKVINHFGLLEETIAYDLGSKVSTQNLAYDAETGEVLLTKTKNDFNDEMYSFNFPAHLAYDRMGPGYKNNGVVLTDGVNGFDYTGTNGQITANPNILVPGDEVQITTLTGTVTSILSGRFWISNETSGNMFVIDATGSHAAISNLASLKVIRSGRRNQQGVSIGSFASLVNPIDKNSDLINDVQLQTFNESYNILNAGAVEYSENWKTFCECGVDPNTVANPYLRGILGNWRTKKSYSFLSDRKQSKFNNNANIRKDGTCKIFKQFWTPFGSNDWTAPADLGSITSDWTWTSEVTEHSPFAPELENKDALNRYSAAVYGYNNALPIAVGSNTQYRQMANDNFEDYDFDDCPDDHFSYERKIDPVGTGNGIFIDNTQYHSGRRSIKVPAGKSVKVNKVLQKCTD